MRYYVTSDTHGFYTALETALKTAGYYEDMQPHKLLIVGDLFDRGDEALRLQTFILDQMENDSVILIKGNHEDMNVWDCPYYLRCEELEAEQVWIETEKGCVRCLRAKFKNLELKSVIRNDWRPLISGFWGYPHMLEYEEPYVYSRLLVSEESFNTRELALKNAHARQPGL